MNASIDVAKLAKAHYDAVFRFCAVRVGADRAADATQEAFLIAHRNAHTFRGGSAPLTWVLGIALNECRRLLRKEGREGYLPEFAEPVGDSPESRLVNSEVLKAALAALSEDHRAVVVLHEIDGLTQQEISDLLGIPTGTVKSRLHHAFAALRKAIYDDTARKEGVQS